MFEVGDRVRCIRSGWNHPRSTQEFLGLKCPLVVGEVYTIVGFITPAPDLHNVLIDGVYNPQYAISGAITHPDYGWAPDRFRKLRDISQSLRELKELAINCPALVEP